MSAEKQTVLGSGLRWQMGNLKLKLRKVNRRYGHSGGKVRLFSEYLHRWEGDHIHQTSYAS